MILIPVFIAVHDSVLVLDLHPQLVLFLAQIIHLLIDLLQLFTCLADSFRSLVKFGIILLFFGLDGSQEIGLIGHCLFNFLFLLLLSLDRILFYLQTVGIFDRLFLLLHHILTLGRLLLLLHLYAGLKNVDGFSHLSFFQFVFFQIHGGLPFIDFETLQLFLQILDMLLHLVVAKELRCQFLFKLANLFFEGCDFLCELSETILKFNRLILDDIHILNFGGHILGEVSQFFFNFREEVFQFTDGVLKSLQFSLQSLNVIKPFVNLIRNVHILFFCRLKFVLDSPLLFFNLFGFLHESCLFLFELSLVVCQFTGFLVFLYHGIQYLVKLVIGLGHIRVVSSLESVLLLHFSVLV